MFGAFKPSAPLSGGLLWKIPWRLSPPQKLRHRRRMRRVDNVVSVLDTALKRSAATADAFTPYESTPAELPNSSLPHQPPGTSGKASPSTLASTAQGQRIVDAATHSDQEARRHGRGPRQGEMVPEQYSPSTATPGAGPVLSIPSRVPLGDVSKVLGTTKLIERWKIEMPTEAEMLSKDKYTIFDKKHKGYRKGVHKLPKWTRVSQRLNPPGF
ncbi:hypothetical protein Q7P37_011176 [Cladosporium fusiforme]